MGLLKVCQLPKACDIHETSNKIDMLPLWRDRSLTVSGPFLDVGDTRSNGSFVLGLTVSLIPGDAERHGLSNKGTTGSHVASIVFPQDE
jgi:hypothetical protein